MMYNTKSAIKYAAATCLLFLTVSLSPAQNLASAKILSSSGSVQITRLFGGVMTRIKLRAGDALFTGDSIKTGFDGRLVIRLADGSQAIISPSTTVEIKDTNNSPRTIFNVIRGKTRIKIEKLGGKPNPYRVTTPTTVIAVRGTVFDVFVEKEETKVFVLEGAVSVALLSEPEREVLLAPGQFTRVKENASPQPPAPFKLRQNDNIFNPVTNPGQGGGIFDNPSQDNPGRGNSPANPPGNNPGNPNVPANPGKGRGRGGN